MTIRPFIFIALISTLVFISCNKTTPTGFWENYKKDLLIKNISNQGPYGGHRAVYWKSETSFAFDAKNILDFAKKNGWTLTDSLEFAQNQTMKWTYDNKKIFPLSSTGFNDTLKSSSSYNYFPRWFGGQLKLTN